MWGLKKPLCALAPSDRRALPVLCRRGVSRYEVSLPLGLLRESNLQARARRTHEPRDSGISVPRTSRNRGAATGFFYAPGPGLAVESEPLALQASANVAGSVRTYMQIEKRVLGADLEGVALRYGFFYGPGTWFHADGDIAKQVRLRQYPIAGAGQGVWSWVHIEDAAAATVVALRCSPGVYNIVDDDPSAIAVWLPSFASAVGAPEPPRISEQEALETGGPDIVYYATQLRGASNAKAKRELGFVPRRLEWLSRTETTGPALS